MLSTSYRNSTFSANTVHSTFQYPVHETETPQINWDLRNNDLIVIDEISMVSAKIFQHVVSKLQQLHVRPVVLLCGDQQQQRPIATFDGKTKSTEGDLESLFIQK